MAYKYTHVDAFLKNLLIAAYQIFGGEQLPDTTTTEEVIQLMSGLGLQYLHQPDGFDIADHIGAVIAQVREYRDRHTTNLYIYPSQLVIKTLEIIGQPVQARRRSEYLQ